MNSEKRDFDKEAASWDEQPQRVKLAEDAAASIIKQVSPNAAMDALDFGCGTGLLTLRLQPLVRSIAGVDSSQGMLDILDQKIGRMGLTNVRSLLVDLDKGDVLSGAYDLIVSSMTLHHVKEIRPLIDQFYRIAAPSGYLSIADLDLDDGQFHKDNTGVFHFGFDRAKLRKIYEQAGFQEVQDITAAEMTRPTASGEIRTFTIFLMTGRKKP